MQERGVEPLNLSVQDPKSCASASSATPAEDSPLGASLWAKSILGCAHLTGRPRPFILIPGVLVDNTIEGEEMARPVTLFTGQWADLTFDDICKKAKSFGYDGVEFACWGDHFEVDKAAKDKGYCKGRWDILQAHGLRAFAISSHLVGQAVCDLIDERHKLILPPDVWGNGEAEGVRKRAAQKMIDAARACRNFIDTAPKATGFPAVVNGFTGSSIWHSIYAFPPTDQKYWQKGFDDFATRWRPILAEFEKANVNFALEVHPTEIAFDIASAQRAIDAIKGHKRFGFNYDPSHLGYQHVDYVKFIRQFGKR